MIATSKLMKRKAISPVIATVILVAVAISVSVAVSYWMGSIAGQYTSFEKIEIQSGYAAIQPNGGWIITLVMKNSGSATANLMTVFVNDEPVDLYDQTSASFGFADGDTAETGTNIPDVGVAIESGKTAEVITGTGEIDDPLESNPVEIYIGKDLFSSGTTINIKVHSAGGMDYIKLVKLT